MAWNTDDPNCDHPGARGGLVFASLAGDPYAIAAPPLCGESGDRPVVESGAIWSAVPKRGGPFGLIRPAYLAVTTSSVRRFSNWPWVVALVSVGFASPPETDSIRVLSMPLAVSAVVTESARC